MEENKKINIHALIDIYNSKETIRFTLESLLGKVDHVIILDGRWVGVRHKGLHSTDGTIGIIADFAKNHPELPITIILAENAMHQYKSKTFLLDQVPEGDWAFHIDSDEVVIGWDNNLKEFLKTTDKTQFRVGSRLPQIPYSTVRFFKKTKGLHYQKDHRYVEDNEHGFIPVGDLEILPIQLCHHPLREVKAIRPVMNKYKKWRHGWEQRNAGVLKLT